MHKCRRRSVLLGLGALGWSKRAQAQSIMVKSEQHAVWLTNIDSDVLFTADSISRAVTRLARLNFTTIYPTIWNGGYTLYPSLIAERVTGVRLDPHPGLQRRDVLAELLDQGHRQGLRVIPWFEFGLVAPVTSALALQHPDWLAQRQDGTTIVKDGQDDRVWLNPLHPQVQEFMVQLLTELVTTYPIDGIQLDDHFGWPVELGYDPLTLSLYQQEHHGQSVPSNPRDPAWVRWRADKLTELMTQIFRAVKICKPKCLVTLAPNPQDFSYSEFLQDWQGWIKLGLVEELTIQIYRQNQDSFTKELRHPTLQSAQTYLPVHIGILTGLKNLPMTDLQIRQQVQATRSQGFRGVAFFYYETLSGRDPLLTSLFTQKSLS